MSGRDREAAAFEEVLDDRHAQRASLLGIGRGSQLVHQDQGALVGKLHHGFQLLDVRGKGAQALGDGLQVADVGEHLVEPRELRLVRRNRQAGLCHQGQQSDGLQHDGLTTRIGTTDEQHAAVRVERQRNRRH